MLTPLQIDEIVAGNFMPLIGAPDHGGKGQSPGILVGVTYNGGSHTYASVGSVPLQKPGANPAIQDIVVFIGSNTKVVTATLLALATFEQTAIAIDLTTPVDSLLPNGLSAQQQPNEPILLWHLATHSAGYPDGPCGPHPWGDYAFDQMTSFLQQFTPSYDPGLYWHYSNQGFALLGALLSHAYEGDSGTATGWDDSYQKWGDWAAQQVLSPLSMSSTQLGCPSADLPNLAMAFKLCTDGRFVAQPVLPVNPASAAIGAGALTSTLGDMLTFLDNQITPPSGNLGKAIALTQAAQGSLSMGLAWQIGQDYFEKNGLVGEYASYMAFDPASQIGLFAMANSLGNDDGGWFCNTARRCLGELRGAATPPPDFPLPPTGKPLCPTG
jgi:beta-lactamase class C